MKQKNSASNSKNGITLIALIITIIVMLILVGVTLSMVIGENGILGKSKLSKEKYNQEAFRETVTSLFYYDLQGNLDYNEMIENESLKNGLESSGYAVTEVKSTNNNFPVELTATKDGTEYSITFDLNGIVEQSNKVATLKCTLGDTILDEGVNVTAVYVSLENQDTQSYEEFVEDIFDGKDYNEINTMLKESMLLNGINWWLQIEELETFENLDAWLDEGDYDTIEEFISDEGYEDIYDFALDYMYIEPWNYMIKYVCNETGECIFVSADEVAEFWFENSGNYMFTATKNNETIGNGAINIKIKEYYPYGEKVNYSVTVNNVTLDDWKILYNDSYDNIYIIYGGYLPNSTGIIENLGLTAAGNYGILAGSSNELLQKLSNSENWKCLINNDISGAEAKGIIETDILEASIKYKYSITGDCEISELFDIPYDKSDKLYFPFTSMQNYTIGYWTDLEVNNDKLRYIDCDGRVGTSSTSGGDFSIGIRPVIKLNNATLTHNDNYNYWEISK